MNDVLLFTILGVIIFLTHYQTGITGFGCTVLALPFVTLLLDIKTAVPMLVIVGWLVALVIVIESWRRIVWREFLWIAIPVGLFMPVGLWMSRVLPAAHLKLALGVFTTAVGIHGLVKQCCGAPSCEAPTPSEQPAQISSRARRRLAALFLPAGGILHGAFGSGGPMVIVYATRAIPDKTLFRVTLCLLWTVMNTILIGQYIAQGTMTPTVWKMTAFAAPIGFIGVLLGNRTHHRTNVELFRKIVFSVLIASGLVLGWKSFSQIKTTHDSNAATPTGNLSKKE